MKLSIYFSIVLFSIFSCQSQSNKVENKLVGGGCQGYEAIFEYGTKKLTSTDTLPDFHLNNPKLKISGTVYKKDGKTPAKNVILYFYQTNKNGIYKTKGNEKGWGQKHGYIRGWVKTGDDGRYTIYTFRPAPYPDGKTPEHIHLTVKEPNNNEYYMDGYIFDDDPILTSSERKKLENIGGSGILYPIMKNGILTMKRDLILGLNIPDYE